MILTVYSFIFILMGITSLAVIQLSNPVIRMQNQIIVYLMGAFIFLLLDNHFQGLAYIIVYVGAIAILFLFVIMMIPQPQNTHSSGILILSIIIFAIYCLFSIEPIAMGDGGGRAIFDGGVSPQWYTSYFSLNNIQNFGYIISIINPIPQIGIGLILLIVMIGIIILTGLIIKTPPPLCGGH